MSVAISEDVIAVGAHPGLPDLLGFGRRVMAISPEELYAYVVFQAGALSAVLQTEGMTLHHIKPHGALYTMMNTDEALGEAYARAVIDVCPEPMIYYPAPVERHAVTRIAADMGISLVTLANAWVLANPVVTAPIVGASKPEQLADAVAALDVTLDDDVKTRLDELTREYLDVPFGF